MRRPLSPGGWLPIPLQEIHALREILRLDMRPWEVDVLLMLDDIWLQVQHDKKTLFDVEEDDEDC